MSIKEDIEEMFIGIETEQVYEPTVPMTKEQRRQRIKFLDSLTMAQQEEIRLSEQIGRLIAEKVECTVLGIEVMQCGNCDNPREPGKTCSCGGI